MKLSQNILDLCQNKETIGMIDGYFRVLKPNVLEYYIDPDFFEIKNAVCFAISVFAEFLCEAKGIIYYVDLTRQISFKLTGIEELESIDFYNDTHYVLFEEAKQRLGLPSADKCYAFTPMLHIGGSRKASTLEIVGWEVHLSLLTGFSFF